MCTSSGIIQCEAELRGVSPITFGKVVQVEKESGEDSETFDKRVWRHRMHVEGGMVVIPGAAIKGCLYETAKYLSESVPSKGKATYTKHFLAGVLVPENPSLGVRADDVEPYRMHVPSKGQRGGATRVWRHYPIIPAGWEANATILLLDPILIARPEKVHEYLVHGGKFIGMGAFRVINGGWHGRFEVTAFSHAPLKL